jgi:hypothetical protein
MSDDAFVAALAALSEVKPADLDFDNPRQVAALRALSYLRTAEGFQGERGYGFVRRVVDTTAPRELREQYPHSDAQHLFIMAWAATCTRRATDVEPDTISWLNISLLHLIDRVVGGECHAQCDRAASCATESCELSQLYKSYAGNERTTMTLERFVLDLSCPDQRAFVRDFYDALKGSPAKAIEKSQQAQSKSNDVSPDRDVIGDEPPRADVFAFPFLNPTTNKRRWIVGARLAPWNGVRLRLPAGKPPVGMEDAKIPESYDLFGVWHVNEKEENEPLTLDDFVAVQGAFVPSDMRERVYDTAIDAAAAARNMSHNLGSHAISHIAAQLVSEAQPDPRAVATFLLYLQQRASLIAVLATAARWPFSVSHSLKAIITDFNAQSLLLENLCLSEGFAVGQVLLRGNTDVDIELPGSAASRHAIFAILENFARNSALHSAHAVKQIDLVVEARLLADRVECKVWDENAGEITDDKLQDVAAALRGLRSGQAAGLGASDMRTWAKYAEMVGSAKPEFHEIRVDKSGPGKQLALFFSLQRSRLLADGESAEASTARLILYRCDSADEFAKLADMPGRWIKTCRRESGLEIRTRFGRFLSDEPQWKSLHSDPLDESVAITALSAYLLTLRRYVFQTPQPENAKRDLALVIRDGRTAKTIRLPFEQITGFLEAERERPPVTVKEEPFRQFNVGHKHHDFAIWERHNRMLDDIVAQHGSTRLVHYENYAEEAHPYRQLLDSGNLSSASAVLLWGFLAEAALMRGVIVDERLAKEKATLGEERLRRSYLGGVEILDPYSEADMNRLRTPMTPPANETRMEYLRPVFVSVHASLARNRFANEGEWTTLLDELQNLYPIVGMHSGGGASPKMQGLPFHELSLFGQWVSGTPCKLFVTEEMARSSQGRETWL